MSINPSQSSSGGGEHTAAMRLLEVYQGLAEKGEHLFGSLIGTGVPRQWAHYPDDDAVDESSGFQWFYHSHSPDDRPGSNEHGHIHLFARRKLWSRRLASQRECLFSALTGSKISVANTRHLLAIGFDAKGIPVNLFTVNSWVTGDLMLSAGTTANLLDRLVLDTGHPAIDSVLESIIRLHGTEIHGLLVARDQYLLHNKGAKVLDDETVEVLSALPLDIDTKLLPFLRR